MYKRQLLIIIWCIPQLVSALPMTKGMKYLAYGISYIGISFIGPAWLEFAFLYSRRKPGHAAELLLFGISAVNYSVLLTNEYHHLFYVRFEVAQVVYGPVFYIHMAYTYILSLIHICTGNSRYGIAQPGPQIRIPLAPCKMHQRQR